MKQNANVITYQQMIDTLQMMIITGMRSGDEAFKIGNKYFDNIEDSRTGDIIAVGELAVMVDVPPLKL